MSVGTDLLLLRHGAEEPRQHLRQLLAPGLDHLVLNDARAGDLAVGDEPVHGVRTHVLDRPVVRVAGAGRASGNRATEGPGKHFAARLLFCWVVEGHARVVVCGPSGELVGKMLSGYIKVVFELRGLRSGGGGAPARRRLL
jgi:hypothetical protein